jgi:hypothetical protein
MGCSVPEQVINPEYYTGCFATVQEPNSPNTIVLYTKGFNTTEVYDPLTGMYKGNQVTITGYNKTGNLSSFDVNKVLLDFPVFASSFWFTGSRAILLSRLPVRRKERGTSINNTELIDPVEQLLPQFNLDLLIQPKNPDKNKRIGKIPAMRPAPGGEIMDEDSALRRLGNTKLYTMLKLFSSPRKNFPLMWAKKLIRERDTVISCPLSRNLAIAPSFTEDYDYVIFRRAIPIALLKEDNTAIMINPLYKQELRDQLPAVRLK